MRESCIQDRTSVHAYNKIVSTCVTTLQHHHRPEFISACCTQTVTSVVCKNSYSSCTTTTIQRLAAVAGSVQGLPEKWQSHHDVADPLPAGSNEHPTRNLQVAPTIRNARDGARRYAYANSKPDAKGSVVYAQRPPRRLPIFLPIPGTSPAALAVLAVGSGWRRRGRRGIKPSDRWVYVFVVKIVFFIKIVYLFVFTFTIVVDCDVALLVAVKILN